MERSIQGLVNATADFGHGPEILAEREFLSIICISPVSLIWIEVNKRRTKKP